MSKDEPKNNLKFIFLFWLFWLIFLIISNLPDTNLHLVFCDVGQGDAILIHQGNNQILIDGGPKKHKSKLLKCIKKHTPFWDRKIELLVNTHPDEDHFGGLIEIVGRFKINYYLHNGVDNDKSQKFQELKKLIFDKKICSKKAQVNDRFCISKICFDIVNSAILAQRQENNNDFCQPLNLVNSHQDLNDDSIVLMLNFNHFDALLTGDISAQKDQLLVWRKRLKPVEVLKIAHHGSKANTSDDILKATQPKLAVISVGENSFGHPSPELLARLENFQIKTLTTDESGTIEVITDGKKWRLKKEKVKML